MASLKKDITKKLFAKEDSLADKLLASPRIMLSLSNTIVLDGTDTGILRHDFAQQLRRKNADVPDINFNLLNAADISPIIDLIQNGTGSLSKFERRKLQRLYTHCPAANGSVRNLAKASKLPVSKVRQFLHSKDSYTKFTLATRKFRRMRATARYKNEIWCMDLAYVGKLAKDNKGIKYLLVRQDVFDKTIDVRGLNTKDSDEARRAFVQMITKRRRPQKIWVDKGKEFAGEFKKFCNREGIQIYSTMSEGKATFGERAMKNELYL